MLQLYHVSTGSTLQSMSWATRVSRAPVCDCCSATAAALANATASSSGPPPCKVNDEEETWERGANAGPSRRGSVGLSVASGEAQVHVAHVKF